MMTSEGTGRSRIMYRLCAAALILLAWKLLTLIFPPMVFPTISSVMMKLQQIATTQLLYRTIALTTGRLAIGLGLGVLIGCLLGALMGLSPRLRGILFPIINIFQTIPPVSWVVMALIWFGFNGKPAIFIIVTATLPVIAINVAEGFAQMDRRMLEMAQVYRFSRLKKLRHVVLPSLFPYFSSALRIALGGGWKIAVMGEVLTTSDGIGGMIKTARLNIEPESVVAWSVVVVLLFYLSDWLMTRIFRMSGESSYAADKGS